MVNTRGRTRKNLIVLSEIQPGPLPEKSPSLRRKRYSEYLSLKGKLDYHFRIHPERRMLEWLPLWKGTSTQVLIKARTLLRASYLTDSSKYLIVQRGNFLYFTICPPEGERTEEQQEAFRIWHDGAGRRGGRPLGSTNSIKKKPIPKEP